MAPSVVHLPNGQNLTVTPVFGGLYFKSNELATHNSAFPPGWTIVLNEADDDPDESTEDHQHHDDDDSAATPTGGTDKPSWDLDNPRPSRRLNVHRYKRPTLRNDHLFISSISNPPSSEFRPASSPTRQIAMMLWASLWWYFHQPEPEPHPEGPDGSAAAAEQGAKSEWRININQEGIFKGKNLLAKLERMGLIATEESFVGAAVDDRYGTAWRKMFVSRRAFWQIDARIFLFTLSPVSTSPFPSASPYPSRPSSPSRSANNASPKALDNRIDSMTESAAKGTLTPSGLFQSNSHLPTYYPPHPPQYVCTDGVRHPLRPKPFRQGETFYTRYVPSVAQYLSFRVASLSPKPSLFHGPVSAGNVPNPLNPRSQHASISDIILPGINNLALGPSDLDLLHTWMNEPRINQFWGGAGSEEQQEKMLRTGLKSRHSIPIIGCWDDRPFGYFEIYWVKEDRLGQILGDEVHEWARGVRGLVGEHEFRGPHRVHIWLSALIHYCWLSDMRTTTVYVAPSVDNTKFQNYCLEAGFRKQKEINLEHKQATLMKVTRDAWEKPVI